MNTHTAAPRSGARRVEIWLAWSLVVLFFVLSTAGLALQIASDRPEEPLPGGGGRSGPGRAGWRTEISGCGRPAQVRSIRTAQEGSRREFQQWRHPI